MNAFDYTPVVDSAAESQSILLRVPGRLAAEIARVIPPRQRNRYIVELLNKDLQEKAAAKRRGLAAAAQAMNAAEAASPQLVHESDEWLNARMDSEWDGSSEQTFDTAGEKKAFERKLVRRK